MSFHFESKDVCEEMFLCVVYVYSPCSWDEASCAIGGGQPAGSCRVTSEAGSTHLHPFLYMIK
jgi:hypothetical protein